MAGLRQSDVVPENRAATEERQPEKHQTRQQKRAQKAHLFVKSRLEGKKGNNKDYVQIARRFPALVQSCGLAQALAFVDAKEGQTGKDYINHLAGVMNVTEDLGEASRKSDLMKYQRLNYEAIESATWLKRYSEALLGTD